MGGKNWELADKIHRPYPLTGRHGGKFLCLANSEIWYIAIFPRIPRISEDFLGKTRTRYTTATRGWAGWVGSVVGIRCFRCRLCRRLVPGWGFGDFSQTSFFRGFPRNPRKTGLAETGLAEFEKMRTGIWQFFL